MPIFIYVVQGYSIPMHRWRVVRADHPENRKNEPGKNRKPMGRRCDITVHFRQIRQKSV
ncbi:hypothetical protein Memar_2309 [Methanoculleus marisnigri JR1]|uniref:Uncharacterized protein n=1 Tax=Methanoculleus marisnigri (strain ATCC 35101 / DSM 1498 / JR1) TaxID=368407 RepID=A3CXY2_METMJ|nr:hypothetical protein Memar_2309 [Methanoculleus marisnigri JR1]